MTIDEIEYIKKCVHQDYISYDDKCKIVKILNKEENDLESLSNINIKKVFGGE